MSARKPSTRVLSPHLLLATVGAAALLISAPVIAQAVVDHSQHVTPAAAAADVPPPTAQEPAVDHSAHVMPATPVVEDAAHDHAAGTPPTEARDPHAYSGGYALGAGLHSTASGHEQLHVAGTHLYHAFKVDQLERVENEATTYDLQAWISQGFQRLTLKAEGDVADERVEESHTELLWSRALTPYWDTQLGLRHDSGVAPDQSWLAFGIQGLAPYWFEIDATAYLGKRGRTALRLEAEYELRLTQQLILQPLVELNFYGDTDTTQQTGSGLATATVALRLRYEVSRQFAPYAGVERTTKFGASADFARAAGARSKETRFVAGVRFWFQ